MPCLRLRWCHQSHAIRRCSDQQQWCALWGGSGTRNNHNCALFGRYDQMLSRRAPRLGVAAAAAAGGASSEAVVVNSGSNSSSVFDRDGSSGSKYRVVPLRRVVDKDQEIVSGKVDQWIRDSVEEIVNNIEEAPFLVHIYSSKEEDSSKSSKRSRVVREKASADSWPAIKTRWERGSSIPNGIALVEELDTHNNNNNNTSSTKVWGIVIQEKGVSCPASYILETSRVRSVSGTCTHFCLLRAECFTECAETQLKNMWLLGSSPRFYSDLSSHFSSIIE